MAFILWLLTVVLSCFVDGIALMLLWGWFVAPTFGVHPLSVVQAVGVVLIATLMTHHYVPKTEDDELKSLLWSFLTPVFFVILGWFFHLFL